jgi:hypothetical protein
VRDGRVLFTCVLPATYVLFTCVLPTYLRAVHMRVTCYLRAVHMRAHVCMQPLGPLVKDAEQAGFNVHDWIVHRYTGE